MKDGWKEMTLGDISVKMADGPFGSNLKAEHYTTERQVRIIQLSNIGDEGWREDNVKYTTFDHLASISRSEVFPNDIVIAKMMPAGRAIICPSHEQKFVLSSDAVKVELKKGFDSRFINYSINSPYFRAQVYENVSGSGRVRTSLTKLRACYLRIPSLSEQQSIVEYLDSSFAKIDAMKANAEKALEEAKALFQASLKSLLEPKDGWTEKNLIGLVKLKSGDNLPTHEQVKGPYPVYGGNGITGMHNAWNVDGPQILIGRVGALCGNIHFTDEKIWVTDNAFMIMNISDFPCHSFMVYELEYLNLNQYASQTAQPVISNKSMKDVVCYLPSLSEQQYIVATLDGIKAKVDQLQANYDMISAECDALKQALLKQVFE